MSLEQLDLKQLMRSKGFKATQGRVALLQLLAKESIPLTVAEISRALGGADAVTLYRALEAFASAGLVAQVDFLHGHAHWEFVAGKKHHHHVVCTGCGAVEDVIGCEVETLGDKVARRSEKFKSIYSHNLEFFGSCVGCAK